MKKQRKRSKSNVTDKPNITPTIKIKSGDNIIISKELQTLQSDLLNLKLKRRELLSVASENPIRENSFDIIEEIKLVQKQIHNTEMRIEFTRQKFK